MHYPFRARGRATETRQVPRRDVDITRSRVSMTVSRDREIWITVFELPLLTYASRDDSAKGITGIARRVALVCKRSPLFPHVHRSAIQIMTSATNKI